MRLPRTLALLVAGVAALSSCATPEVKILDEAVAKTSRERILFDSSKLEAIARKTLDAEDLLLEYRTSPRSAIQTLASRHRANPTPERLLTLAEVCSDNGDRNAKEEPLYALGLYLDAAKLCEPAAIKHHASAEKIQEQLIYNHCAAQVAELIDLHGTEIWRQERYITVQGPLSTHRFSISDAKHTVHPKDFEILVPRGKIDVKGINLALITQTGFGVPMLGGQKATPRRLAKDPLMPLYGHSLPLNAHFSFSGKNSEFVLQDLMLEDSAKVRNRKIPLEANYTSALAALYFERKQQYNSFLAMIHPSEYQGSMGMYSTEPFRPNKIPLILVHGLKSSAEAWVPFVNMLRADPMVRKHYQIYLFNYPTGTTVMTNAASLRAGLKQLQQSYDPKRTNPNFRKMVIAGHSMGGVISNAQIRDSKDIIYRTVFAKGIDELDIGASDKEEIIRRCYFKANPDISRAILIAAPLRGSGFASNFIGNLGSRLIALPIDFADHVLGKITSVQGLTARAASTMKRSRNSINSLRQDDPILPALISLPVRKGTKIHNIMAQSDPSDTKETGTDLIVPYSSAYLKIAASEKVITPANHVNILEKGECVIEIWKILRKHIGARTN